MPPLTISDHNLRPEVFLALLGVVANFASLVLGVEIWFPASKRTSALGDGVRFCLEFVKGLGERAFGMSGMGKDFLGEASLGVVLGEAPLGVVLGETLLGVVGLGERGDKGLEVVPTSAVFCTSDRRGLILLPWMARKATILLMSGGGATTLPAGLNI